MVLTVTEDTPADMLAGSMELLVQMPNDHNVQTQRVTVQRSTPMMDLLVQIATAHKLAASSYTLQAIGERGLVLPHQPNTPIGALDALQVKLLPKQGTFLRKRQQTNQPFETTFRLQVHLPRNQLYVSRVSPKTNLGDILDEVCREKNLDRNKYELRHPANVSETLDLSLSLQDYHLQEVTLCSRYQQSRINSSISSQDIMALQRQEEQQHQQQQQQQQAKRQNHRHSVFGFVFNKKSKESSLSSDSLGNRSVSPAHSDETARSVSPIPNGIMQGQDVVDKSNDKRMQNQPRPLRKRRPAPKPPIQHNLHNSNRSEASKIENGSTQTQSLDKDKIVISHSRNSSDSSGYHEASVLSDNPDNNGNGNGRMGETLPRRGGGGRMQGILEAPRKLAHTAQASKSLSNLALASSQSGSLSRGVSNTSLSSAGQRKKRAAPAPPIARPLPSAISIQGLERIIDSDESLTSDMELSKPSSDIAGGSDIGTCCRSVEPARVSKDIAPKPRKVPKSYNVDVVPVEVSAMPSCSSPSSFGLPSLTEDEREAIDSIVEAVSAARLSPDIDDIKNRNASETSDEVFYNDKIYDTKLNDVKIIVDKKSDKTQANYDSNNKLLDKDIIERKYLKSCDSTISPPNTPIKEINVSRIDASSIMISDSQNSNVNKSNLVRSESDVHNLNLGAIERHGRRLTCDGTEIFTFALNPNIGEEAKKRIEASLMAAGIIAQPTDTDILLQKVSDTLSNKFVPSKSETNYIGDDMDTDCIKESARNQQSHSNGQRQQEQQHHQNLDQQQNQNQQDTSDYVSANGEDIGVTDWDYQIPAPPSEFRDDDQDSASGGKLSPKEQISIDFESIKQPISIAAEIHQLSSPNIIPQSSTLPTSQPTQSPSIDSTVDTVDYTKSLPNKVTMAPHEDVRKAEVLSELESKIKKPLSPTLENLNKSDEESSPKIAPVENCLSNFTITTYGRQKNLDIFEPIENENKTIGNYATLTRGRSVAAADYFDDRKKMNGMKNAQSIERVNVLTNNNTEEIKDLDKKEIFKEKPIIHRSKSYITLSNNEKFQNRNNNELENKKNQEETKVEETPNNNIESSKKFTSVADVNVNDTISKHERFSQWRENMLKRTKIDISPEAELQSLQVLKSILPQLKNAQKAAERIQSKEVDVKENINLSKTPETQSEDKCEVSSSDVKLRSGPRRTPSESSATKRYTYSGPPAVSLGSWNERPSLNVQIRNDMDYKFGSVKTNGIAATSGGRTVVNLNGGSTEKSKKEEDDESCVDTTSVNFKELSKAFGQEVRLRPKSETVPRQSNANQRRSEFSEVKKQIEAKPSITTLPKQNGFADCQVSSTTTITAQQQQLRPLKRYTSVVGITSNDNNHSSSSVQVNGHIKSNLKPINGVKESTTKVFNGMKEDTVPKPPMMPVITGVTLKSVSSRPKVARTQSAIDPRDQLLDAIRNFGGKQNLKKVSN